jgi:hypothetical protein
MSESEILGRVVNDKTREARHALRKLFTKLMHKNDLPMLEAALAAYIANHLPGDPVWLMLVGPPSCCKTTIINAMDRLKGTVRISKPTEAGLLSAVPASRRNARATGGALEVIGDFGVILCPEFTTLLTQAHAKLDIMAIFREVYDGKYTRTVGSGEGSYEIVWEGKAGFIGGVTAAIDRSHRVRSIMGERFNLCRAKSSLQRSKEAAFCGVSLPREELNLLLRQAIAGLLSTVILPDETPPLSEGIKAGISALALIYTRARFVSFRDPYDRNAVEFGSPEEPSRFRHQLEALFNGYLLIGLSEKEAWTAVQWLAQCAPPPRRLQILLALSTSGKEGISAPAIADSIAIMEDRDIRRILEDFQAYDLATVVSRKGNDIRWSLTEDFVEMVAVAHSQDIPVEIPDNLKALMEMESEDEDGSDDDEPLSCRMSVSKPIPLLCAPRADTESDTIPVQPWQGTKRGRYTEEEILASLPPEIRYAGELQPVAHPKPKYSWPMRHVGASTVVPIQEVIDQVDED